MKFDHKLSELQMEEMFHKRLDDLKGKSYSFVLNILIYARFVPDCWYQTYRDCYFLFASEYNLQDTFKNVSEISMEDFCEGQRFVSIFIENHNLFGALQPTVEAWNPSEQTKDLTVKKHPP